MKHPLIFVLLVLVNIFAVAQTQFKSKSFISKKEATVSLGDIKQDFNPVMLVKELPKPGSQKIVYYNYPQEEKNYSVAKTKSSVLSDLDLGVHFQANPWGISTPNDNDIAISNGGKIISVVNSNIVTYDTKYLTSAVPKSLSAFTSPVISKHQESDPKVLYDPKTDRFIFMCFTGFVDTTSKLIFGFSQTNDPDGSWNLYTLPGNPLNNHLWSDYPMLAMTEKELFLSINLLYNDSSWQTGFVETVIWQIKKDSGYAGLPLGAKFYHDIKYGGKSIRNLCPAKGGSKLYKPNMFFISNRNFASMNDTVFLVEVTDTISAPTHTINVKVLKSSQPYYFPPGGRQTVTTQTLATNDARTLGAFYENGKIQYVHNTKNPANGHVTAYYGIVDNPSSASPTATGYIVPNDTVDFGFPNISYAGLNSSDNTAIITFNHTSNKLYAGVSAIKADALGNFSPVLRIKSGATYVDILTDPLERWGDYSGSQTKYNNPGEVWMSGYYAYEYGAAYKHAHASWIAQIGKDAEIGLGLKQQEKQETPALIFPNPAQDLFSLDLSLAEVEYLSFELYDNNGKLIDVLLRDWVKVKQNTFQFSIRDLSSGVYYLKVKGNKGTDITKKIIKG